ncbi:hypothetical protein IFR05_002363 [Cadophora sp. M221]|nr:hypothetical protein IFR05_002363 [Cadophora sp. M221]
MPGQTIPIIFTLFPKLPLELQLTIWGLALPGPIIVRIVMKNISKGRIRAKSPIAALLHVSEESRAVALKKYELVENSVSGLEPIYFDFNSDTLFTDGMIAAFRFGNAKISRISNLF